MTPQAAPPVAAQLRFHDGRGMARVLQRADARLAAFLCADSGRIGSAVLGVDFGAVA
jgi:hypothetical protein